MRVISAVALACGLLVGTSAAFSQPQPQSAAQAQAQGSGQVFAKVNAQQVARILQQAGYRSETAKDNQGNEFLKTAFNNQGSAVFFYNCDKAGCRSYQFWTYFAKDPSLSEAYANAWNSNYLFARAYLDSDGDFNFVMDVNADGGITGNTVAESAHWYDALMAELFKFRPK